MTSLKRVGDTYIEAEVGSRETLALVPTSDGLTTGLITSSADVIFATVTSAGANDIVTLPAPIPGRVVRLLNGATGYEIRTNDPATVGINGGVGAAAESAVAASLLTTLVCVSATNWIGAHSSAAGVVSVVQVAAA